MKTGIHFLFGAKNGLQSRDFPALLERFAKIGFTCVELPPEPFLEDPEQAVELVRFAESLGVEIVFSCGFAPEYDMASPEEAVRKMGAEHLKQIFCVMERAGIRLLGGTCYTKWPSYRTQPLCLSEKREITLRTAEVFSKTVQSIGSQGITVALEPLNRFEGFLINTAAEGVAFCELVGNDNVGLMLDGFHMCMEEDNVIGAVTLAGKRLKHLHLAENNRKLPGLGCFPWQDFFRALKQIGYTGRLDIESFMTPEGEISASVALWRDLGLRNEPEMLKNSLDFIRNCCAQAGL